MVVVSPGPVPAKRRTAFGDITNALRNVRISHFYPGGQSSKSSADNQSGADDLKRQDEADEVERNRVKDEYKTDYDRGLADNPHHLPIYAQDIFDYYRSREVQFRIDDYLQRQPTLTANMRAILVDWMIESQENFEFNHETLYQAVKLTDLYLTKKTVTPSELQLIGATAMLISSKFDERLPPSVDDFLYVCGQAYNKEELLEKERFLLKTVDFDIGFPLSYRFQRRYAKATGITMQVLTLARYILETSLMFYEFVVYLDSEMAAASLLLAMEMSQLEWTPLHVYHSKYERQQLLPLMWKLNAALTRPVPGLVCPNVKAKYANPVFFEVANVQPLEEPMVNDGKQ